MQYCVVLFFFDQFLWVCLDALGTGDTKYRFTK